MLLKHILLESKFDAHALVISREIINAFKRGKTFREYYELDRAGEKAEFTVIAYFIKSPNLEYSHSVTGSGEADKIKIYIHYKPKDFPAAMNDLVAEVKETVVHELEHVGQQNFEDMFIVNGKKYSNYIEYLTSAVEVPAYVKGLIKRARTKKISLEAAMDEWFRENKLNFVGPATRWSDVKPVWMKWAQANKDKIKKFTETNESFTGAIGAFTLYGLMQIGTWAYRNIKYWTSKPGRFFKKIENDPEFFEQLIELLSKGNKDPLESLHYIWGERWPREQFITDVFELPKAIEFRKRLGLDDKDMRKVKQDFEEAMLNAYVYRFIKDKLNKVKKQ